MEGERDVTLAVGAYDASVACLSFNPEKVVREKHITLVYPVRTRQPRACSGGFAVVGTLGRLEQLPSTASG